MRTNKVNLEFGFHCFNFSQSEHGIRTEIKVIGGPSPASVSIINNAENENVDLIVVRTGKIGL